jgi:hypothetical protein
MPAVVPPADAPELFAGLRRSFRSGEPAVRRARTRLEMVAEMSLPGVGPRSARYFFHLYKGEELISDERGVELDALHDLRDVFVQSAREMLRSEELDTSELEGWEVRVVDAAGTVVQAFPLRDLKDTYC